MTNLPPDPPGAEEAELRSEDDGMPVHPAKSEDPAAYAKEHVEQEPQATSGYPIHPVAKAVAEANATLSSILDDLLAPRNRNLVIAAGLVGFGVATLLRPRASRRRTARFAGDER